MQLNITLLFELNPQSQQVGAVLQDVFGKKGSEAGYKLVTSLANIETNLDKLKEKFKGKRAYVTAGAAHGQALITLLNELGFEVVGAAVFHHDPVYDSGDDKLDILGQAVKNYGDVPDYRVCNKQACELVNALNRIKPDFTYDFFTHKGAVL